MDQNITIMPPRETAQCWETETLNNFTFDYNPSAVEDLNNQTKVVKRNAFGSQRHDRLQAKIFLHHQYKWSFAGKTGGS